MIEGKGRERWSGRGADALYRGVAGGKEASDRGVVSDTGLPSRGGVGGGAGGHGQRAVLTREGGGERPFFGTGAKLNSLLRTNTSLRMNN